MTFSISNLTSCFYPQEHSKCQKVSDVTTVMTDLTLTIGLVVVGGLILGGILNAGIPGGISWAMVAAGGGIVLIDSGSLIIRLCLQYLRRSASQTEEGPEMPAVDLFSDTTEVEEAKYNEIAGKFKGVCVGSEYAFIDVTQGNPEQFDVVITLCPISGIDNNWKKENPPTEAVYRQVLSENNAEWHYVGKALIDRGEFWYELVYNCTYPDEDLAQIESTQQGFANPKGEVIHQQKGDYSSNTVIEKQARLQDAGDWFGPIFAVIDDCITNNKKLLIHCTAGHSRSVTLLCAYLIKSYEMNPEEAIALVKESRGQQASLAVFGANLQIYYNKLYKPMEAVD